MQGSKGLSVPQAITSLAALSLLAAPLSNLLYAIPKGWAALGCFERIQAFLLETSRIEKRSIDLLPPRVSRGPFVGHTGVELRPRGGTRRNEISVSHASFGWSGLNSNIIKDINTSIQADSPLTILIGPVGCGKSTFLKGLLGETPDFRGQVQVSSAEIAYCDQTPWIIHGSIRDNVIAESEFDATWYATVIQACALDIDFRQMPDGDLTAVGSKGITLSGGQKQRLVS